MIDRETSSAATPSLLFLTPAASPPVLVHNRVRHLSVTSETRLLFSLALTPSLSLPPRPVCLSLSLSLSFALFIRRSSTRRRPCLVAEPRRRIRVDEPRALVSRFSSVLLLGTRERERERERETRDTTYKREIEIEIEIERKGERDRETGARST